MSSLADAIADQAGAIARTLTVGLDSAAAALEPSTRLWFVGTGTSQHAAELGAAMFAGGERPVAWRSSAAFAAAPPPLGPADGVLVLSHTTETALARRARTEALRSGAHVISVTGPRGEWPEAVQTPREEISETYTVSYTTAVVVLARLALALGRPLFTDADLSELPDRVRASAAAAPLLDGAPERLVVITGAGPAHVTAREGALKLREAARILAEGYESESLLHGHAVPLDRRDAMIAVAPSADRFGLTGALARAAAAQGLAVVELEEPHGLPGVVAQIPLTVRLQVLAADLARARGVDPDHVIAGAWADERLWALGAPPEQAGERRSPERLRSDETRSRGAGATGSSATPPRIKKPGNRPPAGV